MKLTNLKKIAVFCGSHSGKQSNYREVTAQLAESFMNAGIALVYGGAHVGIMGELANQMLQRGVEVIGVMPQSLVDKEIAHEEITELHVVESMYERKLRVSQLADGYILLPGGCGSLDEFFEVLTEIRFGFHNKPCGILNVNHYYDLLIKFLDHAVSEEFLEPVYRNKLIVEESPQRLLQRLLGGDVIGKALPLSEKKRSQENKILSCQS